MTDNTNLTRFSTVLAVGGLAWVAKVAVISATDGAETGAADTITSVLYVLGAALMSVGLAGMAVALTAGRHAALRALAGIAGFLAFFATYVIVESIAQAATGDAGPAWFEDEVGILATGAVLAALGFMRASGTLRARAA